jgi:hypothetical protein
MIVAPTEKQTRTYRLTIVPGKLGLPDSSYYLQPTDENKAALVAYNTLLVSLGKDFTIPHISDIVSLEKDVAHLDFVISFTSESYYRATPSGVFFDCIKWEIPILSLNNSFINYYFTKYGKVGEIFTDTSEMVGFIKDNLINSVSDFNQYFLYLENIKKLKHFLSVEKLSEQFAKQI